ncbi:MAG: hypothetical protein ACRC2K_13165 [Clostridium sp.]
MPKGRIISTEKLAVELYKLKWNTEELNFRDVLMRLYIDEGKTYRELAEIFFVSKGTISSWMKIYGVPVRRVKLKC